MLYLSYTPHAPLNEFVERLWFVEGGHSERKERILPSGTVELVVNLHEDRVRIEGTILRARPRSFSGTVVSGTYSEAFVIDARQHESMMGVHFRPGGAFSVLGVPPTELTDGHVDLGLLFGKAAAGELRERLCMAVAHEARFHYLEQWLFEQFASGPRPHAAVSLALARFTPPAQAASVRDVAREVGLSHRRFLTLFTAEVGLPPKLFCRIRRFRHLHACAQRTGQVDWAQLALECGFFDQSHLINEFRKLSGLTPTEYERDLQHRNVLDGHVAMS